MVGDIEHAAVDLLFIVAQHVDQGRQYVVGVENGVVVSVDDLLFAALVQCVAGTHWGELLERLGYTFEVFGAVTAHLVQYQYGVVLQVVDKTLQVLQQNLVVALLAVAQGSVFSVADIFEGDAIAGAFAAGLVVAPDHVETGALEHVE